MENKQKEYRCKVCDYIWKSRSKINPIKPKKCPNPQCQSHYWDDDAIIKRTEPIKLTPPADI